MSLGTIGIISAILSGMVGVLWILFKIKVHKDSKEKLITAEVIGIYNFSNNELDDLRIYDDKERDYIENICKSYQSLYDDKERLKQFLVDDGLKPSTKGFCGYAPIKYFPNAAAIFVITSKDSDVSLGEVVSIIKLNEPKESMNCLKLSQITVVWSKFPLVRRVFRNKRYTKPNKRIPSEFRNPFEKGPIYIVILEVGLLNSAFGTCRDGKAQYLENIFNLTFTTKAGKKKYHNVIAEEVNGIPVILKQRKVPYIEAKIKKYFRKLINIFKSNS